MFRVVLIRIVSLLPILVGISVVTFSLIRMIPGDPVIALLGMEADETALQALRSQLALDRPLVIQYFAWASRILTGDFGRSIQGGRDVLSMLLGALGPTAGRLRLFQRWR